MVKEGVSRPQLGQAGQSWAEPQLWAWQVVPVSPCPLPSLPSDGEHNRAFLTEPAWRCQRAQVEDASLAVASESWQDSPNVHQWVKG